MSLMQQVATTEGGTITPLLLTLLKKLLTTTEESQTKTTTPTFIGGNNRIPTKHVRKYGRRNRKRQNLPKQDDSPQAITQDTMPIVHDRLPDPEAWKKFQDMEDSQNDYDVTGDDVITEEKYELQSKEDAYTRSRRHIFSGANSRFIRRRQLYARTGYHIQIMPDGAIASTMTDHDTYGEYLYSHF